MPEYKCEQCGYNTYVYVDNYTAVAFPLTVNFTCSKCGERNSPNKIKYQKEVK